MLFNSKKTATVSALLLALFLNSLISCNTRHDSGKAKSADPLTEDSLQIKELAVQYRAGKETFLLKCAACHDAPERHVTDQYIFDNLFDRMPKPSEDYFIKFIKNSKDLKASGDSYALKLAEMWNTDYDHAMQDTLSNQDLGNLIVYIKIAIKQNHRERQMCGR